MGTKKFLVHWRFGNEICIKSDKGSPLLGFEVSWFQVPTFRSKFSQSSSGRYLVLTLWSLFFALTSFFTHLSPLLSLPLFVPLCLSFKQCFILSTALTIHLIAHIFLYVPLTQLTYLSPSLQFLL